jgi:hypothetical protein
MTLPPRPLIDYAPAPAPGARWYAHLVWLLPLLAAALLVFLAARSFTPVPVVPTPAQVAALQSAYDQSPPPRGESFRLLAEALDLGAAGVISEGELVRRLGPPDGLLADGGQRVLVYYYNRQGARDAAAACAVFYGRTLHKVGHRDARGLPPRTLSPYTAPSLTPATMPTTAPTSAPR